MKRAVVAGEPATTLRADRALLDERAKHLGEQYRVLCTPRERRGVRSGGPVGVERTIDVGGRVVRLLRIPQPDPQNHDRLARMPVRSARLWPSP